MVRPWRGGITNLHQCIPRSPGPLSPAWHRARVGALCRLRCLDRGLRQTRDRFGVECSSGLCEDKTSRSGCGGASMQNRPARARSRLARLMDRPRAECNTIINFASPSATSPDFELPIKRRFRRQILVCCPRERFEILVYSSSPASSSSSGSRVRIRYDTNCPSSSSLS